jgi:hypothetical protein
MCGQSDCLGGRCESVTRFGKFEPVRGQYRVIAIDYNGRVMGVESSEEMGRLVCEIALGNCDKHC